MNRLWAIIGLVALWSAQGCAKDVNAQNPGDSGWHQGSLKQDNLTRYFRYFVPKTLPNHAPVVILLHGGSQSMRKIFGRNAGGTQEWQPLAEKEKFLLVVPNGVNPQTGDTQGDQQNWNDCRQSIPGTPTGSTADDVRFTRQLIAWAALHYPIDQRRVYATGASNGGEMSYRLAMELSDQVAAVAAFIANLPKDSECKPATHPVPIMILNGSQDPLMLWQGGRVAGGGGEVVSAQATLDYWLRINRSETKLAKTRRLPDLNRTDDSYIVETIYPARPAGAEVWFYKVEGGGHSMPSIKYAIPQFIQRRLLGFQNQDLEGADAAWSFLSRQRLLRQ
jgi:polyhydroxybutyrate depolymerase